MFLCRVRKSLKGQVFCARYSRNCLSKTHKHNLCRVGRRLRKGFVYGERRMQRLRKNSYC
jgi:hypothetical protein